VDSVRLFVLQRLHEGLAGRVEAEVHGGPCEQVGREPSNEFSSSAHDLQETISSVGLTLIT